MSRKAVVRAETVRPAPAPREAASRASTKPLAGTGGALTRIAAKLNARVTTQGAMKPAKAKPATRRGKKGLVLYVDPEVALALRRLALDTGESVQSLGLSALDLLFAAHGRPQLPVKEDAR